MMLPMCLAPLIALLQAGDDRALAVTPEARPAIPIGLRAKLDRPVPIYRPNQPLLITLMVDTASWAQLWELDAAGKLEPLYEGRWFRLVPGQLIALPALTVQGPIGESEIHIRATTQEPKSDRGAIVGAPTLAGSLARQEVRLSFSIRP